MRFFLAALLAVWAFFQPDPPRHRTFRVKHPEWNPDDEGEHGDDWKEDATGKPEPYGLHFFKPTEPKDGPFAVLRGCPRCGGVALLRRRDSARLCRTCDRVFYPLSEDSVIRYDPRWHRAA